MTFFVEIAISLLPARWQQKVWGCKARPAAAVLSGMLEFFLVLALLVRGYFVYTNQRLLATSATMLVKAAEQRGDVAVRAFGLVLLAEYFVRLTTIVLLFFAIEGAVRASAALVTQEIVPTLPLYGIERLEHWWTAWLGERRMGERIPDAVSWSYDGKLLRIASCRPKLWTSLTTISHEGTFLELASQSHAEGLRPYVYELRKKPLGAVIRGVHPYDANEVLLGRRYSAAL